MRIAVLDTLYKVCEFARVHGAIQCADCQHDTQTALDPLVDPLEFSLQKNTILDEMASWRVRKIQRTDAYPSFVALLLIASLMKRLHKGIGCLYN